MKLGRPNSSLSKGDVSFNDQISFNSFLVSNQDDNTFKPTFGQDAFSFEEQENEESETDQKKTDKQSPEIKQEETPEK